MASIVNSTSPPLLVLGCDKVLLLSVRTAVLCVTASMIRYALSRAPCFVVLLLACLFHSADANLIWK